MVRPKGQSKKQQKRGIDFKKIKRKIGRKLPPPKNTTNTEIKSKAIVLPEQSVASEKSGLAVSKKGLTLKELLQQTSHHNSKVRKDAIIGIRDVFLKHPAELKLHKLAVIEKLRERISDDDKMVRETLYQLLKEVIFPGCKEDNQGPFISLMMAYIFNAMTHLAIDVRLMAFKFFELVVQYYPTSFSLYAEKILQNYQDILRQNQFYLQDKGKLKSALAGLARCISLLPCNKREDDSSIHKVATQRILHALEPDEPKETASLSAITDKLNGLFPILVGCFSDFIQLAHSMPQLDAQSFDCVLSILQSVHLVVKFFVYGIDKSRQEFGMFPPPHARPNITLWDENMSPLFLKKLWDVFPLNPTRQLSDKEDDRYFILNVKIAEIFLHLSDWINPPSALLEKFVKFIENALFEKICGNVRSGKAFHDKHSLSLIPFIPKVLKKVSGNWKSRILQAFTKVFKCCNPESSLKLACISAIEEMLIPEKGWLYQDKSDPEILDHQITWLRELPFLLILLGDKFPSSSKSVLLLQLHLGQRALMNSSLSQVYDNMQDILSKFYSTRLDDSTVRYGTFIRLPRDIQELSVCCLYYFSSLELPILQSLTTCCLCHDLEPFLLFRIVEVLHSSYKAGHIQAANYISFLVTLLLRYEIFTEKSSPMMGSVGKSKFETLKSITSVVCSLLPQIGDDSLVFQMLEKVVLDQIPLKPPLENICALLRMLVTLDSRHTRLSEQSIINLGSYLPGYLLDIVSCIPEDDNQSTIYTHARRIRYYLLLPFLFLFYRSDKLLNLVLNTMGSFVSEKNPSRAAHGCTQNSIGYSSTIGAIVSVLLLIYGDAKMRQNLLLCKAEIEHILQNIVAVQSSEEPYMTIEERYKIRSAYEQLKVATSKLLA